MENTLEKIKKYIMTNYNSFACGYTEERSSGNETDIFNDGFESGKSDALYSIGKIIGMELVSPEEPKYSWED